MYAAIVIKECLIDQYGYSVNFKTAVNLPIL